MSAISNTLNESMAQHRAGNLDVAENGYREILRFDPSHAESLHLMGVAAVQRGEPWAAIEWFEKARQNAEPSALLLNNLGTALRDVGRFEDAVDAFRQSVSVAPEFAGARFNLALALEAGGNTGAAVAEYEAAICCDPGLTQAHLRLGGLKSSLGDFESAIESLKKAKQLDPRTVEILFPLAKTQFASGRFAETAKTLRRLLRLDPSHSEARKLFDQTQDRLGGPGSGVEPAVTVQPNDHRGGDEVARLHDQAAALERAARFDDAIAIRRRILELDPANTEAHAALGRHAVEIGQTHDARRHFLHIAESQPDHLEARLQLSNLFADKGAAETAIEHARRATRIAPRAAVAWLGLANLLKDSLRLNESAECYRAALDCDEECPEAVHNLGIVHRWLGKHHESIACFDRLIHDRDSNAQAHLQRSLTRLAMGDLSNGWDEYEWRWRAESQRRRFAVPEWDGSPLNGKTVLIHAEQGIGDQIQFASCLPNVVSQRGRVIVECERRLVPLFARSFPACEVVPQPYSHNTDFDFEFPLGSLPRLFRRRFTDFPTESGDLRPDVAQMARWRERYEQLGDEMTVGISWRGGSRPGDVRSRSTQLAAWQPILSTPGVQFVNLQYGDVGEELDTCRNKLGVTVHDWNDSDPLINLDDFAAQIAALDLVVSIDNSTVHLAGALGIPVWTLLPFAADFRWMRETARSPWYPSMRLYRQNEPGDWAEVFAAVGNELALKVRGRSGG